MSRSKNNMLDLYDKYVQLVKLPIRHLTTAGGLDK